MKNITIIAAFSLFLFGCNMNSNKEARIQKLETELQQTSENVKRLENRIQTIEVLNTELKTRMLELEKLE